MQVKLKIFSLLFVSLCVFSCKQSASKQKSLESDDYFKDGKDRFYFAHLSTQEKLEGNDEILGHDMLFGVGCVGEDHNQGAIIDVPESSCSSKTKKMSLNARTMMHQFKIAKDPSKLQKGECLILMGNAQLPKAISENPKNFAHGANAEVMRAAAFSLGACGLTVGTMLYAGPLGSALAKGSGAAAVHTSSSTLLSASAKVSKEVALGADYAGTLVNALQGAKVVSLTAASSAASATQKGALWVAGMSATQAGVASRIGISALPCSSTFFKITDVFANSQSNKNRKIYFDALTQADQIARKTIAKNAGRQQQFSAAESAGNIREAMAIYNPYFAASFNSKIRGKFENGWGSGRKFFDMVKELQNEIAQPKAELSAR